MLLKLLRYTIRWTAATIAIGSLTYALHDKIERFIHDIRFYTAKEELGFIQKDQAFDLKFVYERNGKGNLETKVKNYAQILPVYSRENGIMIGASSYNFSNFTYEEKKKACSEKITETKKPKEKQAKENKVKKPLKVLDNLLKDKDR